MLDFRHGKWYHVGVFKRKPRKEKTMNTHNREKFQTIDTFQKEFGVHITTNHTGKMTGFASLSTSPLENTFCKCRAKCKASICHKCYSMTMQKMYGNLSAALVQNYRILTKRVIPVEKWPLLNYLMFRLESFGDVQNETQLRNYVNFCKRNPRVQFTIWTKNTAIFGRYFKKNEKPKNLLVIVSSPFINKAVDIRDYPFADKVFTVYDKAYVAANKIVTGCSRLSCNACQKCYNRKDKTIYINELLK